MELYGALAADWYRLIDPPEDHEDEAATYGDLILGSVPDAKTLLELGSGAGHNALFLKKRFECTLADLSRDMLTLSRELNPECEHVPGDMRSMRLDRTFDAVFVHDAISYITTRDDLRRVFETVFAHLRSGGVAVLAPDGFKETFFDCSQMHEADDGGRSLRCIEWFWDPDPEDETIVAEYVFALREGGEVRVVHDRHLIGEFPKQVWLDQLQQVGFEVEIETREVPEGGPYTPDVLVCLKP